MKVPPRFLMIVNRAWGRIRAPPKRSYILKDQGRRVHGSRVWGRGSKGFFGILFRIWDSRTKSRVEDLGFRV